MSARPSRPDASQRRKRLRSTGRVRTVTPPPGSDLLEGRPPGPAAAAEIESLRAELRDLKRLQEAIHFLGSAPDLLTLRGELLDLALSLSGLRRGLLALPTSSDDEGGRRFKVKGKRGFEDGPARDAAEFTVLRRILNDTLETREALVQGNLRDDGILGHAADSARKLRLGAVASLPLVAGGHVLGGLLLDDPQRLEPFSPAEEHLLRSFARHAAVALARVAAQTRLRRQAATLERRNERLEAELERSERRLARSQRRSAERARAAARTQGLERLPYREAKRRFTRDYLAAALARARGDLCAVSRATGLPLPRLIGLLDTLRLGADDPPGSSEPPT